MTLLPEAAVCGRFQPLHNEHLDYILEAKRITNKLWIGLVSPSSISLSPAYRLAGSANPLTFDERVEMIIEALADENVPSQDIVIVPFDLEQATNIPSGIPMLITKCDTWSDKKEEILRKNYSIRILKHRPDPQITGSAVRHMILNDDGTWTSLVPMATIRIAARVDLRRRLQSLTQSEADL